MESIKYDRCTIQFPDKPTRLMYTKEDGTTGVMLIRTFYIMDTQAPLGYAYKVTGRRHADKASYTFSVKMIPRTEQREVVGKGKRRREIMYAAFDPNEKAKEAQATAQLYETFREDKPVTTEMIYSNMFRLYGKPHEKFENRFTFIKWLEKFLVGAPSGNPTNDARTFCVLLMGE